MEPETGAGSRSVSRPRCPRSSRALPSPPAPPLPELFGLKASWGNGARSRGRNSDRPPVPAAGRDPTRVGDGSVSFPTLTAARGQHTPAPALPNSFSSFYYFFLLHIIFIIFIYFRGVFFLSFSPLSWAGKAPQPGLAVPAGGCGSPAPAWPLQPRPGRNAAGAGEAARAEPGCRGQPGQPQHGGFRSLLGGFVCKASPKP